MRLLAWMLAALIATGCNGETSELEHAQRRNRMVRETMAGRGVTNIGVLNAMRRVPRHEFTPPTLRDAAYDDRSLPIGHGRVMSQPYVVAYMTSAAAPMPLNQCLEIGTGTGYQAAILAELCRKVHTIEPVPELAAQAEENLRRTGYGPGRVSIRTGDGRDGWPEREPFDVIVISIPIETLPDAVVEQLNEEGRLIAPMGAANGQQRLVLYKRLVEKSGPDALASETLLPVRLAP